VQRPQARCLIEKDPDYTFATARLLFHIIAKEILGDDVAQPDMPQAYAVSRTNCSTKSCMQQFDYLGLQ